MGDPADLVVGNSVFIFIGCGYLYLVYLTPFDSSLPNLTRLPLLSL